MPSCIASGPRFTAASVGPALPALTTRRGFVVHSIFRSALNLSLEHCDMLATITGPAGAGHPNTICLEWEQDFGLWPLCPGSSGEWGDRLLRIFGPAQGIVVDCSLSRLRPRTEIPGIRSLGGAFLSSIGELSRIQSARRFDLRIASLFSDTEPGSTGAAMALVMRAKALGSWVAHSDHGSKPRAKSPGECVASLVGLGQGLTPSGDDFLSGFIAAAQASSFRSRDDYETLIDCIEPATKGTNDISASALRSSVRGFFPGALISLAQALDADDAAAAIGFLTELCSIGHSSGADMATGYLYGLSILSESRLALSCAERRLHAS